MLDQYGRNIHYLRISVTDRCNLRCFYCMPAEGIPWIDHSKILSYEDTIRLVRIFASLGIDRIRLTGGEPLVRKNVSALVAGLKQIEGIRTVSLTTNGVLLKEMLPKLMAAGLDGVNISLDTLDRRQYEKVTRRDELLKVIEGIAAALAEPKLTVKINCVALKENKNQWVSLARLAKNHRLAVRFIEMMPIGLGRQFVGEQQEAILKELEPVFGKAESCPCSLEKGPGRYVKFAGFKGYVGFISPMSHAFCASCNRVRLTSTGFLKGCLQYSKGVDLHAMLLSGADDAALREAIRQAIYTKPEHHHFQEAVRDGDEKHTMNEIGG
ncbi:MAG: GTP 3',8-cyclase MoaA [Acidaminococcus sp.]|jgi:cyclic pyranopterin phosphate synthase|nr:GTP 3',8-cyclase MoaA [Acidaminococcus sp.]MCI2100436.1 GTP 3',8-cyclase MoaA [Acidaminococcus sp.]MCI2114757.1 GTP 3',8-cyclase MoaA [Acidaminococcus sp.]MCI2116823.1 GTP 3',8-cyclase MoaA [Acidaminococcus sp.]